VTLKIDDLGADFVGCNLHKWIGAPIGAGVMYVREGRLASRQPDYATCGIGG
jgi:selenocysteine lyase/cysteine desulfurase